MQSILSLAFILRVTESGEDLKRINVNRLSRKQLTLSLLLHPYRDLVRGGIHHSQCCVTLTQC